MIHQPGAPSSARSGAPSPATAAAGLLLLLVAALSAALALAGASAAAPVRGGGAVRGQAKGVQQHAPVARVLLATDERLVVEFTSPPLHIEPHLLDGVPYTAVTAAGLSTTAERGRPRLPVAGLFFALPPGAHLALPVDDGSDAAPFVADASAPLLRVLEDDLQPLQLAHPPIPVPQSQVPAEAPLALDPALLAAPGAALPAAPLPLHAPEPALYAPQAAALGGPTAFYPQAPAAVAAPLTWRGGPIAALRFYPLQVVPHTGEARYHRRLRVEIRFAPAAPGRTEPLDPLAERLLLHAQAALSWQETPAPRAKQEAQRPFPSLSPSPAPGAAANAPANAPMSTAAGSPWIKVAFHSDGWYRIGCAALSAAGLDTSTLRLSTLRLLAAAPFAAPEGADVALRRVDGDDDDRCTHSDGVEFWGAAAPSRYSDRTIYWLAAGQSPGLALAVQESTTGGVPLTLAQRTVTLEADRLYRSSIPARGDDHDHWFWDLLAGSSPSLPAALTYTLTLGSPAAAASPAFSGAQAFVTVTLAGLDGSHRVRVTAAGMPLGDLAWNGRRLFTGALPLPLGLPAAGDTPLRLELDPPTQGLVLVDHLEVSYWAAPAAPPALDAGATALGGGVRRMLVPSGAWQLDFGEPQTLLDISDPRHPIVIAPLCPEEACAGQYGVHLDAPHTLAAVSSAGVQAPAALVAAAPPHLAGPGNGADYILIAPAELLPAAQPLADRRRAQGLRVAMLDVQQIYDEFASGQSDAEAIRRFLAYTYRNWQKPAPTYVLLLGDGTFDPRGRCEPLGACPSLVTPPGSTLIPPLLADVDPWLGETAADSRLGAIGDGSPLPFFAIGRLPANSPAEAQAMVAKVLAYEDAPPPAAGSAAPSSSLVFVADNAFAADGSPDPGGNFWQMADAAAAVALDVAGRALGAPPLVERLYLNLCDPQRLPQCALSTPPYAPLSSGPALAAALSAALDRAPLLVHYNGHGSIAAWAGQPPIWGAADIATLPARASLPIVVDMTCYTGYFQYPGLRSLAETWLAVPHAGAAAVIASSGLGMAEGHRTLDNALLVHLFAAETRTVGDALLSAKLAVIAAGGPLEDVDTFALFGDPAMPLHHLHPQPTPGLTPGPTPATPAPSTPTLAVPHPTVSATPPATVLATASPTSLPCSTPTPSPEQTATAPAPPAGLLPLYLPNIQHAGGPLDAPTPGPPRLSSTQSR